MLAEPPPTQADVHFRVAGFPVRVHPLFWVIALLLGLNSFDGETTGALLAIPVVFVSILVHELGHAFLQRKFGGRPRIVLHGFGGLAICGDCDRSPRSQILISLAGPFAGFALAAITILFLLAVTNFVTFTPMWGDNPTGESLGPELASRVRGIPLVVGTLWSEQFESPAVNQVVRMLLYINIFWGLMNLLPVYPLDGGQVAREVMTLSNNPQLGIVASLQLSIGVAAVVAVWGLFYYWLFMGIMFGFLAYNNYRMLQAYTGRGPGLGWG